MIGVLAAGGEPPGLPLAQLDGGRSTGRGVLRLGLLGRVPGKGAHPGSTWENADTRRCARRRAILPPSQALSIQKWVKIGSSYDRRGGNGYLSVVGGLERLG